MQREALADIEVVTPYTSHYQRTYKRKKGFLGQVHVFNLLKPLWKQIPLTPFTSLVALPKRCCRAQHWEPSEQSSSALDERASCAILDLNQNKHPEGIHQRQGCPQFWERAEVD